MNLRASCSLVLAFNLIFVRVGAEETSVYDLDRCVRTALSENPALTFAQKDVDISDARRRASGAALLTAFTLKASETTGRAADPNDPSNPAFLERSYGVQATQPLFAGGKLFASRRQAVLGSEIARLQLEKQRLDVLQAVTEAYWQTVAAERALAALRDARGKIQEDLEKAVRHELSGFRSAKIELLSTRVQNRECESAIGEQEDAAARSRSALLDAMGERRAVGLKVTSEIPAAPVEVSEAEAIRLVRDHRPEYKISEKLMESARMARRISGAALAPRVDLNGYYGRSGAAYDNDPTNPFHYQPAWNAGVSMSWAFLGSTAKVAGFHEKTSPELGQSSRTQTDSRTVSLGLGDAISADIESLQGRRDYMEEEWRFEKARRDLEEEARSALRRLRTAWSRAAAAQARVEEADQQFKETLDLLKDDRAHLGDLAGARLRSAQARSAEAEALAQHRIALAALNRAVGVADYFGK